MINPRPADSTNYDLRRKRLQYRSGHRGCKETDLIFGKFCEIRLATLSPTLLATYEQLLDENDSDIWVWLTGKGEPPEEYRELLAMMNSDSGK